MATDEIKKDRQLLNSLISKYAYETNVQHGIAWGEFKKTYNLKYRTNIDRSIQSYKTKYKLKVLSVPAYLAISGQLEKSIAIAEGMLENIKY